MFSILPLNDNNLLQQSAAGRKILPVKYKINELKQSHKASNPSF